MVTDPFEEPSQQPSGPPEARKEDGFPFRPAGETAGPVQAPSDALVPIRFRDADPDGSLVVAHEAAEYGSRPAVVGRSASPGATSGPGGSLTSQHGFQTSPIADPPDPAGTPGFADSAGTLSPIQEDAWPRDIHWEVGPGGYRGGADSDAWTVGFSPPGEAPPNALTDVLLRGSHWVRSARRAEAQRRERSAAIAAHVEAQLAEFLDLCAGAELVPPVTVRVVRDVPRRARQRGEGRPRAALREDQPVGPVLADQEAAEPDRPPADRPRARSAGDPGHPPRWRGRNQLVAWPLLYWRCESFPSAGRSLHLFVEPGGRTFEGRDDPAPLTVLGRLVRVWPVDAPSIVEGMAEVDARRCALHLVDGMAHLLWRAGVGL
ncbi:hypothetical protein I6A84_25760 [Frankia sp. CNm7]|uniref:Uncharacterized protein n=1 Tax=Frankia nepalensis TaxID=1836974 RepID=A0A937RLP1_9ACTN|nr:hypothetical protein [Frankia nepalensis]MBL7501353.1 hypothetical protein [Frankia nepalensis]MBL7509860.1 hypothetical protein [Frankia nepalensis]MBL7521396.1 hypothetical protein [Frankia nepalensis]MBL7629619.1 hypothetical protein [Frankia nepalensis]